MEEKKSKLSIAVVLLLLAIIVIIVMAVFMYKLYNDKKAESEKVVDLNRQTENLNSQINDLDLQIGELQNQVTVLSEEKDEEEENNKEKETVGDYKLNEINLEQNGEYNKDCGISLRDNNSFYINVGEGFGYSGKYKIDNNKLVCQANIYSGEYIEDKATDIVFAFDYVSENTLKIISIDINDSEQSENIFIGCFEIGMTYSKKDYEDIVLDGTYAIDGTDSGWEFTKDGKAYSTGNINVMKGTYKTIEKNSIEVHYTENRFWDERTGKDSIEKVDIYEYMTVDDDNKVYWTNPMGKIVELERFGDVIEENLY